MHAVGRVSRRRASLFRASLLGADLVASAGALLFTERLAPALGVDGLEPSPLLPEILAPVWLAASIVSGAGDFRESYARTARRYVRAVGVGLALLIGALFFLRQPLVRPGFALLFGAVQLPALILARVVLMEVVAFVRRKRPDGHRVVIVGCGDDAAAFAAALRDRQPWNIKLEGHVCTRGPSCTFTALPAIERAETIERLLDRQPVDEVIFASDGVDHDLLAHAVSACDERGVDILIPISPLIPAHGAASVEAIQGYAQPLLGLRRTPSSELALLAKRALDILGALVGLVLASPILLAAAVAVKLESAGPVIFSQVRAGRYGRRFTMYKLRSMVLGAEARRAELLALNEMSGPVFKIRRDPRVTRVGRFIRKTSIDELPQLLNILLGDMSLVGPRPALPSEVQAYEPWQRRRLSVKPGLTGLWQISGRNAVDFEQWMRLDLRYIDTWSLGLDLEILLRTVPAVIMKTGAS